MNAEEFVQAVKKYAGESAVESVAGELRSPPGRKPPTDLVQSSKWFLQLDEQSKTYVLSIATMAVDHALFGFFCIIDGVRAIESGSNKGEFVITYRKGGVSQDLNDPNMVLLHEMY
jgi:hypothetical protein